jgi:hypothetical protein
VHAAFGDHFAVEVDQFFEEPDVLQQQWCEKNRRAL